MASDRDADAQTISLLSKTFRRVDPQDLGAHIPVVADFSKAFDTCHIPALIQKLSNYVVGGANLRLIASLYTGKHALLSVNDVLGRNFRVTNGVTQGCVLI